jgi:hypothetical protein
VTAEILVDKPSVELEEGFNALEETPTETAAQEEKPPAEE